MMMALFSMMLWRLKAVCTWIIITALLTKDNDINVDPVANDWSFIPNIITEEDNTFLTNLPDRNEDPKVNSSKSGFILSAKASLSRANVVGGALGFPRIRLPTKYLGMPLYKGPKKSFLWDDLISKIAARMEGWEAKGLIVGRKGGLGIAETKGPRQGYEFETLVAVYMPVNNLWSNFMKSKYGYNSASFSGGASIHDSPIWKRLSKAGRTCEDLIRWKVGCGKINFWHDIWVDDSALSRFSPPIGESHLLVSSYWRDNTWYLDHVRSIIPNEIVDSLYLIALFPSAELTTLFGHSLQMVVLLCIVLGIGIQSKGICMVSKCHGCNDIESLEHLFFVTVRKCVCRFGTFAAMFSVSRTLLMDRLGTALCMVLLGVIMFLKFILELLFRYLFYGFIWLERNDAKHRNMSFYHDEDSFGNVRGRFSGFFQSEGY
ncbi:REVERSE TRANSCRIPTASE ZINC-BINDING DOMAIN-CONTAINING PROTEIN-RELATED-RELATED [Salix viminalis]|uniref:REVERSE TRANSCRIPTASE ZINC-BINDING DOMAIN-CONTAINING PROTEIN-RELATED-RELATED n=1 Tax=Salix viminalis TaxID=40686 RepID=A0A9Q0UJQ8_SALVM|nr:REVERSE TRANSCRIPTASE ZINC-BINDING DOMAIN-CONTAINING PROTEIN-RELATED-RELATED [Salix viminalis]